VRITKCAFIQTDNHEPEALVEIEGSGIVSIKQGCTLSVTTRQGQSVTIRVIKLAPDEIEVEVPATGEKIAIR
jgi:endonuclease YncB( thermonuclease family)